MIKMMVKGAITAIDKHPVTYMLLIVIITLGSALVIPWAFNVVVVDTPPPRDPPTMYRVSVGLPDSKLSIPCIRCAQDCECERCLCSSDYCDKAHPLPE